MSKLKNYKQLKKFYQKKMAQMVHAFILQASHKSPKEVRNIYFSFNKAWINTVSKVNKRYGSVVLNKDMWDIEWKQNGYSKYISIPIPKQLPEIEQKKLLEAKTELIRLVYIIEGKTDHQRQRRELVYKIIYLKMRAKLWIKSLFTRKPKLQTV